MVLGISVPQLAAATPARATAPDGGRLRWAGEGPGRESARKGWSGRYESRDASSGLFAISMTTP